MMDLSHLPHTNKVYLELTNTCNFRCAFCPSRVSKRKNHFMEFHLFKTVVDEIEREGITRLIGFHILGEPLLHPRLLDAVEYVKNKGLKAAITTNGSLLSGKMVDELIRLQLDRLIISFDSHYRKGGLRKGSNQDPDEYYWRVLHAAEAVKRSSSEMKIKFSLLNPSTRRFFDIDSDVGLIESNKEFRERLSDLARDLLNATGKKCIPAEIEMRLRRTNLNGHRKLWIDRNIGIVIRPFSDWGNAFNTGNVHPATIGFCGIAFTTLGVLSNGDVAICCGDYDGRTSLGSLHNTSLTSLLSSAEAQDIARGFSRYRIVHPHCQKCFGGKSRCKAFIKGLLSIYAFKLKNPKKRNKKYLSRSEF